jgi:N-acetylglucosamine-6-sulfatase
MSAHSIFDKQLSRRDAIRTGVCMGSALLLPGLLPRRLFAAERPPNIVFILSDNQRWDFMSCAGHPFVQTPNMDRLASEGILFSNAFVTTSLCSPSRASFLTGQYAHTHGVKNNSTIWNTDNVTFLELLKSAGYDTAFIGKWHMPGKLPDLRGVDLFVTFTIQRGQGRYIDCPLVVNGVKTPSRKPYITEELTDYALEFISTPRRNPFCLYLSHKAVHHRWIPPPELADLYEDREPEFPEEFDPLVLLTRGHLYEGFNIGSPAELYRNYARVVTAMDYEIGRVLDRLEELGFADDTIVIFCSDGGFFWGEHQLAGTGKWAYEESIRIPFIVRAPGVIPDPGRQAGQMVLNIDVAPTILELAGVAVPALMEGQSFVPVLNSAAAPGRTAWLYEHFLNFPYREPEMHAVRTPSHIYIEYRGRRDPELYDISADPRQRHNLMETAEGKSRAAELKKTLLELKSGKKY